MIIFYSKYLRILLEILYMIKLSRFFFLNFSQIIPNCNYLFTIIFIEINSTIDRLNEHTDLLAIFAGFFKVRYLFNV